MPAAPGRLAPLQDQDVRVGDVHTAGVSAADEGEYLPGGRHPVQQGLEGLRVLVVAHVQEDEAALEWPVVPAGLLPQDSHAESLVVPDTPTEDTTGTGPRLIHCDRSYRPLTRH